MRAFLAIALPADRQASLTTLQQDLAQSGADVKWVEPENLHVSLKFLDEITETQHVAVETLLQRVADGERPFTLGMERVGAFPSVDAPRVLWVGLGEGKASLVRIAEAIEREWAALALRAEDLPAAPLGAAQAGRPFAAHVTIGRVRSPKRRDALAQRLHATAWQPPAPWEVTSLTLYQSVLSPAGPRYTVLAEVPLSSPSSTVDSPEPE